MIIGLAIDKAIVGVISPAQSLVEPGCLGDAVGPSLLPTPPQFSAGLPQPRHFLLGLAVALCLWPLPPRLRP